MLRCKAVSLIETPSGSYFNTSQAAFYPDPLNSAATSPPSAPQGFFISKVTPSSTTLQWLPSSINQAGFKIERKGPSDQDFIEIANVSSEARTYEDSQLPIPGLYIYRVRAWNAAGPSSYSQTVQTSTFPPSAEFLGYDFTTSGQWEGRYGKEGYAFATRIYNLPPSTFLSLSNVVDYGGNYTVDPRVPLAPGWPYKVDRCWAFAKVSDIDLLFTDSQPHQVSLYSFDFNPTGAAVLDLQVIDALTGAVLDSRSVQSFTSGVYICYTVRNHVLFRLSPNSFSNPFVIVGFYIDLPQIIRRP